MNMKNLTRIFSLILTKMKLNKKKERRRKKIEKKLILVLK